MEEVAPLPHDNPCGADWHRDQVVFDSKEGLRARRTDEMTVGPGGEQNLFIICTPIFVRALKKKT